MKHYLCLLALTVALAAFPAQAAGLLKTQVSADAKWLLHLDLQNLRNTQLGDSLIKGIVDKAAADLKAKVGIDVAELVRKVDSITAYGTDFSKQPDANGVLLVQMDAEAQKILEGFLAAQMLASNNEAVKKTQQGESALYSVNNDIFLAVHPKHIVVVGKSQKQIDKAGEVLSGKSSNLTKSDSFSGYTSAPDAFFFLAVAEGFNENSAIPPQAKMLQMADGGRIIIGEKAEKLFLNLALKAKNSEIGEQIQQVIEGIRAMATLSQTDNQELQELARSIKVSNMGKIVSVNAEFPVDSVIKKISEQVNNEHHKASGKHKTKKGSEPKADDAPAKKDN